MSSSPFADHSITVDAVVPGLFRKKAGTEQLLREQQSRDLAVKAPLGHVSEPN